MNRPLIMACQVALAILLLMSVPMAACQQTGVKVYSTGERTAYADKLPYVYNGSFFVYNDGYKEGVYVIRVAVNDPIAITWIDLSQTGFLLKPGESKMIFFNISVTQETAVPGIYDLIIMPALLATNVEPYMDPFANYVSGIDRFNFTLVIPGPEFVASYSDLPKGTPVIFEGSPGRSNLVQYASLVSENRAVTQIDRAIKLNAPEKAVVGKPVDLSVSVFEGLRDTGVSLMTVSPDGSFYRVKNGNFTFDKTGSWGVIVLVGEEMILGKPVNVVSEPPAAMMIDGNTIMATLAFLILLSIIPIWLWTGRRRKVEEDPYDDVIFKAYVVKKNIRMFDSPRLNRVIAVIQKDYEELADQGLAGKKDEAVAAINELRELR